MTTKNDDDLPVLPVFSKREVTLLDLKLFRDPYYEPFFIHEIPTTDTLAYLLTLIIEQMQDKAKGMRLLFAARDILKEDDDLRETLVKGRDNGNLEEVRRHEGLYKVIRKAMDPNAQFEDEPVIPPFY
ncbi:hypothetical protein MPER_09866 [Moniliophthora perniciosa FA553]|nr:hypothetical protein MPER_09866 [Moniliophthora perniciosa FA553]